ncbi:hypothetical protein [Roseomonas sp. BN140053]|uniref:hypothetical protein n=1 Tax=Roseomonas sp. BN140053 TaxID=3391898 RepID=UPI0039ECEA82
MLAPQEEPADVRRGREALARPLAEFRAYYFLLQGPVGTCLFRRVPVAPILDARLELTVGGAVERLRCQACGSPPEIVGMGWSGPGEASDWLLLHCGVKQWRKQVDPPRRPLPSAEVQGPLP